MDKDRTLALRSYEAVYESSKILRAEGQNVVIVAEGDAGLYSPIHYIYDKLQQDDIPVEQIAGIPAFIASGAMAGLHIVSQEERLVVIPGQLTAKELDDYLKHQTVVVIMKLSQCIDEVHQCIINHPEYQYHYFENVGTEKEYYSCSTEELREKRYPYFSVMIIRFG
jgi:precorrin-2 C(20)-methyltransferase